MDLPSGALSYGNQFINLHQLLAKKNETLPQVERDRGSDSDSDRDATET
jgi:hypothetical protein